MKDLSSIVAKFKVQGTVEEIKPLGAGLINDTYKVNTKEGTIYLFFLLELQSYNDFTMPFRLLVYMIAIWVDYFKNCDKNVRKQKDFRLPAIMPIVLHNGEKNWTAARNFKEMIAHANVFGDYVVNFKYELVSINELTISKN